MFFYLFFLLFQYLFSYYLFLIFSVVIIIFLFDFCGCSGLGASVSARLELLYRRLLVGEQRSMPLVSSHIDLSRNQFSDAVALWALLGQRPLFTSAVSIKHPDPMMLRFVSSDRYKSGSSSLIHNVITKPKHVAGHCNVFSCI